MDTSVGGLRRRRRRYALLACRQRVLRGLPLPRVIVLAGGRRLARRAHVFWRIRLPLWAVSCSLGWLIMGWIGVLRGLVAALLVEVVFSYRRPLGGRPVAASHPPSGPEDGGGPAGVREPRRPRPTGGAGSAQLPLDPSVRNAD